MKSPRGPALLCATLLLASAAPQAAEKPAKVTGGERLTVDVRHPGAEGIQYHLFVPKACQPGKTYPLLFALHGNGHAAATMRNQLEACSSDALPVFIVAPQYQKGMTFNDPRWEDSLLFDEVFPLILKEVQAKYPIAPSRRYLCGFSMGGMYSCQWAYQQRKAGEPFPFRALFLYSSCMPPGTSEEAPDVPYLMFVGEKETAVMGTVNVLAMTRDTFNPMFKMGKDVRYLEIQGMGHTIGPVCLETTRKVIEADMPWPDVRVKKTESACAALAQDLVCGLWREAREKAAALEVDGGLDEKTVADLKAIRKAWREAAKQEADRLGKGPPTLEAVERLEALGALVDDADLGKRIAATLDKLRKGKALAAELEAKRLFQEARAREGQDAEAGQKAFEALAKAHAATLYGQRAQARVRALLPAG
jgi:predicted esterase